MKELSAFCKDLKKDFKPKIKDPKKPVSCWSEKDISNKKIVDAFVIIFRTRGCSWALNSGCSMCGYFNDSIWTKISDEDILKQFETAMEKYENQKFVKIFNSGSFLDDKEISPKIRKKILNKLSETSDKISIESRPEFITSKKLSEIKKIIGSKQFEIGIGLETADDSIRKNCINKGFNYKDYKKAAELVKKHGFSLKTYLLIKPPFMTEKEAIDDAIQSVNKIKDFTDIISFNPCNVQRNTVVEYLWKRREYRPPWLFSIVEILKESNKITDKVLLKCDISGGGNIRGAHNCKKCDNIFLKAISKFSLSQDVKVLNNLDCECKEKWLDQLDIEDLGFGSFVNIYG
jgi:hypothetical protein